jgi:branched-chain amino acid transport system ATP-binding protein
LPTDEPVPALELRDVKVSYGAVAAVKGVSLNVRAGELVSLIGANGAGKTSTLNAIAGSVTASAGEIRCKGEIVTPLPAHRRLRKGIALVPEGRGIFSRLTVQENLQMGAYIRNDPDGIAQDLQHVYHLLPRIQERLDQVAGTLSGGEQQMLAIGRALLSRPKVLLLDEPSMGLAPLIIETIFAVVRSVAKQGVAVLLVEQNANLALEASERAYVMETGTITLTGTGRELLNDPKVRSAYLGEAA